MRRLFVIFLTLLFPLNVLALSLSVSSMPHAGAHRHAADHAADSSSHALAGTAATPAADAADAAGLPALSAAAPDGTVIYDLDPDEPPAGMDFHDTVSGAGRLLPAVRPDASFASPVPERRGVDPLPPIKPPPSA